MSSFLSLFQCCFQSDIASGKEVEVDKLHNTSNDDMINEEFLNSKLVKLRIEFDKKCSTLKTDCSRDSSTNEYLFLVKNIKEPKYINKIDISAMNNLVDEESNDNRILDIKFNIVRAFEKSLDTTALIQKSKTLNKKLLSIDYKPKDKCTNKKKKSRRFSYLIEK